MTPPLYTYEVSDLVTGIVLAELPLVNVRYGQTLNGSGQFTGSFQVESRNSVNRRVKDPYDLTMPCRRAITVWRDDRPMWEGVIWTRRYDSSTGNLDIGAGDYWSYFDHRYVIPVLDAAPAVDVVARQVEEYVNWDQNAIAQNLVRWAQIHPGGNLNIQLDDSTSGIFRDRTYEGHQLTTVGDALSKLAGVINGPDILFDVTGPDNRGRPIRRMRVGTPYLGQQGSAHSWEYGANLLSYAWPSDGSRYASRAFAVGDGAAEGTPIAVSEDRSGYQKGWPLMEVEQGYSGITEMATLQEHADSDQFAARMPVALPTITVRGDMHPMVGEWGMGDDANVTIEDDFHVNGLDTVMRIVASSITPGEEREDVVLTMSPVLDNVA